jgi:SAM-dependent methyltransferase
VSDDALLAEQLAYYRARAAEYDGWFFRRGRFDRGHQANARWFAEVETVREALAAVPINGRDVLELAPGTGLWTERLVGRAGRLTVVDASPEMLAENRRRLGPSAEGVEYVLADLFAWEPRRRWDAVVFCFWLSHVPRLAMDAFLRRVHSILAPDGVLFFVDGRPEPLSTAADHQLPGVGEEVMARRLDDGREFHIVKNYWEPQALEGQFAASGLAVAVLETPTYFQYGTGRTRG